MIENMNDFLSLISLFVLIIITLFTVLKIGQQFKKEENDDYYRELL